MCDKSFALSKAFNFIAQYNIVLGIQSMIDIIQKDVFLTFLPHRIERALDKYV